MIWVTSPHPTTNTNIPNNSYTGSSSSERIFTTVSLSIAVSSFSQWPLIDIDSKSKRTFLCFKIVYGLELAATSQKINKTKSTPHHSPVLTSIWSYMKYCRTQVNIFYIVLTSVLFSFILDCATLILYFLATSFCTFHNAGW